MADITAADFTALGRLAHEVDNARAALSGGIDRFWLGSAIPHGACGTLPASHAAASQYQGTITGMLDRLRAISDEFSAHADGLRTAAYLFRAASGNTGG
jgi:hypothetical protein